MRQKGRRGRACISAAGPSGCLLRQPELASAVKVVFHTGPTGWYGLQGSDLHDGIGGGSGSMRFPDSYPATSLRPKGKGSCRRITTRPRARAGRFTLGSPPRAHSQRDQTPKVGACQAQPDYERRQQKLGAGLLDACSGPAGAQVSRSNTRACQQGPLPGVPRVNRSEHKSDCQYEKCHHASAAGAQFEANQESGSGDPKIIRQAGCQLHAKMLPRWQRLYCSNLLTPPGGQRRTTQIKPC